MPRQTLLPTLVENARAEALARDSDRDLLTRFIDARDESAFAALLQRHGPTLASLCRRWVGDAHLADDVLQATFLVLARRAKSIRRRDSLASWLFGVARRIARRARLGEAARSRREKRIAAERGEGNRQNSSWDDLLELLDEELQRLPDRHRLPLLLCYLQGRTQDEAAVQLGWSLSTLRRRLDQGRELLQKRLTRRGAAVGVGMASGLLVPKALSAEFRECVCGVAFGTQPASAIVAALASGGVRMFLVSRVLICLSLVIVNAAAVTGVVWQLEVFRGTPLPTDSPFEAALVDDDPSTTPAAPTKPAAAKSLRVVVLDQQGKPLRGADVHAGIWTEEKGFKANRDYVTDDSGAARVELPKTFTILRLWAHKKPFVQLFASWENDELASGNAVPAEYSFRLISTVLVGGRIVDEQGKPVAGAKVQAMLASKTTSALKSAHGDSRVRYSPWSGFSEPTETDSDGRWRIGEVPNDSQIELDLLVSHPDYMPNEDWQRGLKAAGVTTEMLRKETATLTLKRGIIVHGRVTNNAGEPIKDAIVRLGDNPYFSSTPSDFATDADGHFRLPAQAPGRTTLTVIVPGFAPQLRQVHVSTALPPQDFRMEPGKPIALWIIDAVGKPVPNASVILKEWRGSQSLINMKQSKLRDAKIPFKVDADGLWKWSWAPEDSVKLEIGAKGFAPCELKIAGGLPMRTVTLKPEHRVTGQVTDAVTGKPIPAFAVIQVDVFRKNFSSAERSSAKASKDGHLDFVVDRTDIPLRIRIESPGYRTQDGPEFHVGDDFARTQNFRLQPIRQIEGTVLDAAGKPVANAEVLLATPTQLAELGPIAFNNQKATTDAGGRFGFPDAVGPWAVVGRSESGFALAEFPAGKNDAGTLRLRPWASVRGKFLDGGKPVRGATVLLQPVRVDGPDRPRIQAVMQTDTGPDGRFEFQRVPPVPVYVQVHLGPWKEADFRSGPSVPLDLQAGQRVELDLGGAGGAVTGKVTLTGKVPADLDCTYSLTRLIRLAPGIAPPSEIASFGFDIRRGMRDTWSKSAEVQAYMNTLPWWFAKLARDGTFRISGVPAGEYELATEVYAKPSGCLVEPLARKVLHVKVTQADVARGELKLPEIEAEVVPIPVVGETPALAFEKPDGGSGTLADCRGRLTLVHFWASWCGACKKQLPAVRQLNERFGKQGLAVLGLSLDDDRAVWQSSRKALELPWPQGRLAADSPAGVSSVPMYWLLDPNGELIATTSDLGELGTLIAKQLK
jgi:RNA polymerase sigma factor (sigma-70 family)